MASKVLAHIADYCNTIGSALQVVDEDMIGGDDMAGQFMVFGSDLIHAIEENEEMPTLPDALKKAAGRISPKARVWLAIAVAGLAQFESQTTGNGRKSVRYIKQGLMAIAASLPVPPVPALK